MSGSDAKDDLHRYLRTGREALLWKLDGLGEYDVRRPLVPTGTNLLGLVKHLAWVEWGYFALAFDRPMPDTPAWFMADDDEPNTDMWATAEESRGEITGLYERVAAHSDETIETLELDTTGRVPWWPAERSAPTLHLLLARKQRCVALASGVERAVRRRVCVRARTYCIVRSPSATAVNRIPL